MQNYKTVSKVNPDLAKERQKCTFHIEELTTFIDGSAEEMTIRRDREEYFLRDKSEVSIIYLSHKERYEESIRRAVAIFTKARQYQNEGSSTFECYRHLLGGSLGPALFPDGNPFAVHIVMFLATIISQGTVEQNDQWAAKTWNTNIIGTYAQTELGHGTFIRGLETTATYDPATEEFVLNSPTLTSYKWWPGGLGHSANFAIVIAQLYTQGECHGIHPFIVQLRDEETHIPLKGIKIGDIGAKFAMNGANNGYLGMENVRIPRDHMLMKNNKVLKDGTYIKAKNSKLTYGTMVFIRVCIVEDSAHMLKSAVTIATRYSAVRKQSKIKERGPETQIIEFVTQQYRIFPLIATFFAFYHSAKWLWNYFSETTDEVEEGHLERLPELHAISCCLKAVSSQDCAQGVETCRLSCGGHGFMMASNLPTIYTMAIAACTYEGENTVLLLQTARYLIKSYNGFLNGQKLTPTVAYIEKYKNRSTPPYQRHTEWLLAALEKIAASKIECAYNNIQKRVQQGTEYEHAWNDASIELVAIAEIHCRVFVLTKFTEKVQTSKSNVSKELFIVLNQLLHLYGVFVTLMYAGNLLQYTNVIGNDIDELQNWLEELLTAIRPNAVGIVDGFDIHDDIINSTLGSYDGNVYERLFAEAAKSSLNKEPVNQSFLQHVKPFLKSNI